VPESDSAPRGPSMRSLYPCHLFAARQRTTYRGGLFWNDTGRPKSECQGRFFGHLCRACAPSPYHAALPWDLAIHAALWNRKKLRGQVDCTGGDSSAADYAHRKISSKSCGEKIQPQINTNERKSIQDKVEEDELISRRVIGCVPLRSVYEKALCLELAERGPQLSIIRLICAYLRSFAAKKIIKRVTNGW